MKQPIDRKSGLKGKKPKTYLLSIANLYNAKCVSPFPSR